MIQYVETGRNPDIYTREFVELTQRNNQHLAGRCQALTRFGRILAEEIVSYGKEEEGGGDGGGGSNGGGLSEGEGEGYGAESARGLKEEVDRVMRASFPGVG